MSIGLQAGFVGTPSAVPRLGVAGRVLRWTALRSLRRSAFHHDSGLRRTSEFAAYDAWRAESLRQQLTAHFDVDRLRGKDVLDFGCGAGDLTLDLLRTFHCRQVTGVDLSPRSLERTAAKLDGLTPAQRLCVRFIHAKDDRRIELPDDSVDFVCCFDVVEHIPNIHATVAEWRRVLRPGGEIWIWWSPWRGPYGHHVESLIPLPWVHLLLPPETLFAVCAEIYDHPSFVPRVWDLDPETGRKKANKWKEAKRFEPFLNRLTRGQFERSVRDNGLTVLERGTHGFGGSRLSRATRPFRWIPILAECFVSFYIYRLSKR